MLSAALPGANICFRGCWSNSPNQDLVWSWKHNTETNDWLEPKTTYLNIETFLIPALKNKKDKYWILYNNVLLKMLSQRFLKLRQIIIKLIKHQNWSTTAQLITLAEQNWLFSKNCWQKKWAWEEELSTASLSHYGVLANSRCLCWIQRTRPGNHANEANYFS